MAGVEFTKPEEPTFIKEMKEKSGLKDAPTVDTKKQPLEKENGDSVDGVDDDVQVEVLKPGDLTKEEAQAVQASKRSLDDDKESPSKKAKQDEEQNGDHDDGEDGDEDGDDLDDDAVVDDEDGDDDDDDGEGGEEDEDTRGSESNQ